MLDPRRQPFISSVVHHLRQRDRSQFLQVRQFLARPSIARWFWLGVGGNVVGGGKRRRRSLHHRRYARACQRGLDHRDQRICRHERLLQYSIRADALRLLFVQRIKRSHQQDHRDVSQLRVRLDELADLVAVAHGHENIREHEVRPQIGNLPYGGFAIADGNNVDTLILQGRRNHLLDVAVVVSNQNPGHRTHSTCSHPSSGLYHRYWSIRALWRQRKAGGYVSKGAMSNTDSRTSVYVEEKSCLFCMAFGERWATSFRKGVPVLPGNDLFQTFLLLAGGLFFLLIGCLRFVVSLMGVFGLGRSIAASAIRLRRGVAARWIRLGC